ncbi:MAG: FKBP-type peptidyl-prolyl cis-trans isomerase [Bacteroidales bacterium]|nr:FKBP-type peptidyl-prolyl cis-trans isomerase [Bacteroidales bacterium]
MKKITFLIFAVILTFAACKKQSTIDRDLILEYIDEHDLDAHSTASGLYYVIEEEGIGGYPNIHSIVTVYYKGYLLDGTVFDETTPGNAITFQLLQMIPGWQEGIQYFKTESSGKLLVPSALGYGSEGQSDIPENSVLIFDIELLSFEN